MALPLLSHVSDYRTQLFAVEGYEAIFGLPGKGNRDGHLVVMKWELLPFTCLTNLERAVLGGTETAI